MDLALQICADPGFQRLVAADGNPQLFCLSVRLRLRLQQIQIRRRGVILKIQDDVDLRIYIAVKSIQLPNAS